MKIQNCLDYLDPRSVGFNKAKSTFHRLEGWQKVASVVAGIAGAILTPFILCFGSLAVFRWTVEKFEKSNNSVGLQAPLLPIRSSIPSIERSSSPLLERPSSAPPSRAPSSPLLERPSSAPPLRVPSSLLGSPSSTYFSPNPSVLSSSYQVEGSENFDLEDEQFLELEPEEFLKLLSDHDLPEGKKIVVLGDLVLSNIEEFTFLPEDLHVIGNLTIEGCPNLEFISKNLCVNKEIIVKDCPKLTSIYENFDAISLTIENCQELASLPENFSVESQLIIKDCLKFASLSAGFSVKFLEIINCPKFNFLSENITIKYSLTISDSQELASLPDSVIEKDIVIHLKNTGITREYVNFLSKKDNCEAMIIGI